MILTALAFHEDYFNDFYVFDKLSTKIPLQQIYIYF